ncbi:MAG: hypothetical protein JW969_09695 [Spirochaetales bacterium]|nr:hypothetical protein [Spirochaetales bacterium]
MKVMQCDNFELDLFFRIDLWAMRPINGYGMTAQDFENHFKRHWEFYKLPKGYEYVYHYARMDDLESDPSPYIKYVRDLFFWGNRDCFMKYPVSLN